MITTMLISHVSQLKPYTTVHLIVQRQKAKKGPEVEVEYVQTFIAVYCSLGCVP